MSTAFISNAEKYAKNAENYPDIFGKVNLTSIRQNVNEILKLIGRDGIFREYTLHDANHIDALLALVDKLIPDDTALKMKTADWLMIVLSCYFHDLGMLVTKSEYQSRNNNLDFLELKEELLAGDKGKDYEEAINKLSEEEREEFLYQEFVRKNHAKRIYHWIMGQDAPQYGNASAMVKTINELLSDLEQVFRDDLAKICLSHHEDDLFDFDKYQLNRVYGDDPQAEANLHYTALILRSADVLQIQKKRVPSVLYKLIDPSNPKSQEEWAKQAGVRAVKPRSGSDTVEIHASFEKESAYFGLLAYLEQYANKELERCHSWAAMAKKNSSIFEFPWKQIDSTQVEPRGFEGRSYKFTLDQEKILKLLTGHTLYNDSRVAIREVLQNALDAVRFRNFQFPNEIMGKIEILWDSRSRKLTIRDTGTGMTQETIEKFLLNVGSSFYQSETVLQKHSGFSAISRFGIGVLSTFMIADEVQILTAHPEDNFARKLTLPSVVKSYLIKKIQKGDPSLNAIGQHGTEVVLQIRRSAELNNVEDLVRYWLVLPACNVTYKADEEEIIPIGFTSAHSVMNHYYNKMKEKSQYKLEYKIKTEKDDGVELAYALERSIFEDTWGFAKMNRHDDDELDPEDLLSEAPGMCIEGIRIRSIPAGFDYRSYTPWVFANLTGRNAPKTNVARSDIEQTPELEHALFRIYSHLGKHIQSEFDRLVEENIGIVEAANEANFLLQDSFANRSISSHKMFEAVISNLRIVALEGEHRIESITTKELEALEGVWTVDSELLSNIAGVSGSLGINLTTEKIVNALGKKIEPKIPLPRILGARNRTLKELEITSIKIYSEGRSNRIDICWKKRKEGNWETVPLNINVRTEEYTLGRKTYKIATAKEIALQCPDYDVVHWRGTHYIFAKCISDLLIVFGMTSIFGRWLGVLIKHGTVPKDELPLLKDQLVEANAEHLLPRLSLPFERQYGIHNHRERYSRSSFDDQDE